MSDKQTKRVRKEIKRQVNNNVGEGLQSLQLITRKRPKWIPKRVWVLMYLPLFPKKYLKFIFKYMQ